MDFCLALDIAVRRGEMDIEEAFRRDNLYYLARLSPCIADPCKYALDMPAEELPPIILSLPVDLEKSERLWADYKRAVRERQMGPYEAALSYYEAMKGE